MTGRIFSFGIVLILFSLSLVFGRGIYRDFAVWHDRIWGFGVIESVKSGFGGLPWEKTKNQVGELKVYKIRFGEHTRRFTVAEGIFFQAGDSIRVVYSPHFPDNFKIKIPSVWWVGAWAIAFLLLVPALLYYGFILFWGYFTGKF